MEVRPGSSGWGGGQTYHYTGFIRDHLEHVGYRDIAQPLGYCQRCGSILGQRESRQGVRGESLSLAHRPGLLGFFRRA